MLPHAYFLLLFPLLVYTSLVNRTIDDALGDEVTGAVPAYGGNDNIFSWTACSASNCVASKGDVGYLLDPSRVHSGTWHDSISKQGGDDKTITINFSGVAIYVFYTLVVNGGDMTSVGATLDGSTVGGNFVWNSTVPGRNPNDPGVSFIYDQTVFSIQGLQNTEHQLILTMPIIPGTPILGNICLFDYAIYTQVIPDPSTPNSPQPSPQPQPQSQASSPASSSVNQNTPNPSPTNNAQPPLLSTNSAGSTIAVPAPPRSSSTTGSSTPDTSGPAGSQPTSGGQGSSSNSTTSPVAISAVTTSSSKKVPAIAGGVVGGIILIAAVAFFIFWMRRRRTVSGGAMMTNSGLPSQSHSFGFGVNSTSYQSVSNQQATFTSGPARSSFFGNRAATPSASSGSGDRIGAVDPFISNTAVNMSQSHSNAHLPIPLPQTSKRDLIAQQQRQQEQLHSRTNSNSNSNPIANRVSYNHPSSHTGSEDTNQSGLRKEVAELRAQIEVLRNRHESEAPPQYYTQ